MPDASDRSPLSATSTLLAGYGAVHQGLGSGTLEGKPDHLLGEALDAYLAAGWRKVPVQTVQSIADLPQEDQEQILDTVERVAASVQYIWDHGIDWSDPAQIRSFQEYLPALIARVGNHLFASRLLDRDEALLARESEMVAEILRSAAFGGRIKEGMARHGLSSAEMAPTVYAAAGAIEYEATGDPAPSRITVGEEAVPLVTAPGLYESLILDDADMVGRIEAELAYALESVSNIYDLPDLGTAATFEQSALGIGRTHAMERVVDSILIAHREREGTRFASSTHRIATLRSQILPSLERLSHITKWGQSIHSVYNQARSYIEAEKEKEEEFAARRGGDGPGPAVVYPIPEAFDGVTTFGLFLQDSIRQGDPLSLAWNYITDWGEDITEGGFVFSPDEQRELADLTLYAGLSFASSHAVDDDELAERVIAHSGKGFLRERLREIESELRSAPHLTDDEMGVLAREHLERLAETGAIRKEHVHKHMQVVDRMVDRVRAHTEVRRLLAHRAVSGTIPTQILREMRDLPHARRHAARALDNPLWLQKSFTGQSRLELMTDAIDRARDYRRHARDHNVEPFDSPIDRWDAKIADRIGRFQEPRFQRRAQPVEKPKPVPGAWLRNMNFPRGQIR